MYDGSKSQVKAAGAVSEEFDIQVGVHQGSALSPLLFILVMEEATRECRKGDPWELLYADDLVLTADSKREVIDMFNNWRGALERRGLKVNISKTKLMVTGKRGEILRTGRYPCAVYVVKALEQTPSCAQYVISGATGDVQDWQG